MADRVTLQIDLDLLATNLSKGEGRLIDADEARRILQGEGFVPVGDAWVCEEASLGYLNHSEYRISGEVE